MRSLVWFRSDLRTTDNPALSHAARRGEVVAVVTLCAKQWASHDWGPNKASFMLRCMAELQRELGGLNIPLRVLRTDWFRDVPKRLLDLALQTGCGELHFNAEYEINEQRRDERVRQLFEEAGVEVGRWHDQTILPPGSVRTQQGKPYTVYTPFRRAWVKRVEEAGFDPLDPPRRQKPIDVSSDEVPVELPGFRASSQIVEQWPAGQREARRRLERFVVDRLPKYHERRDHPAEPATSELSSYLAAGAVSVRQCLAAATGANDGRIDRGREGATTWIGELGWREFYRGILVSFPRVSMHQPFDRVNDSVRWRYDEPAFERWCDGRTGVPLVDAGMRQLRETGWMHNRLRMIVAMYLSKNLLIDWRWGERYFMQHLVDGDLANNNGGWQWAASTGTDAVPYFRIFNPVRQGERFDAAGVYVRRWCPELADIDELGGKVIHDPSQWSASTRRRADWPEPIVDHAESRDRALAAFKAARADAS